MVEATLARDAWFASLPQDMREDIVKLGKIRRACNSVIFAAGDRCNGLFAVLAGEVRGTHCGVDGRTALLISASVGSWFGETSLLDGGRRYSSAIASGSVELLHLTMPAFRSLTEDRHERYACFVRLLCQRHRLAIDHIASLRTLPTHARIAQMLIFLSRRSGAEGAADESVCLSQEDLAAMIGTSRQTINSELKLLQRRGLIECRYAKILLRDRPALERMSHI
jgi:CRP-like cAMP-binding protein